MNKELYAERLAFYDKLVAANPNFERLGKTMPYTAANTHMFSLLNKDAELGFRYSKEDQERLFEKHNTTYYKSYNAVMNGYILITDEMLLDFELLTELLQKSYEFVMSIPPRKDKKKK